ncbi:peptidoglycan-binding protein [Patescibacteria group bacterium]|nr:peptidoglycan-binding protein [Patescibacteria group bacterium]MBU1685191.1 peptidoglycan-binding protein [Patescibacteria group bacterium]MBU1938344.1 peptidoglycan-binding protein [Patescibacteria group bacterium]
MNTKVKRIIVWLFAALQFAILVPVTAADSIPMENRKLLVTAYYSPMPDQDFYIRGSYEGDIRLNGRGTNGADGTQVYVGMLAAPRTYPFGTRIKIPGLGVGEVHDRGGAILAGRDYDRVDVWMGRGEEGLARALNWGARVVEGEVYFTPHQIEPGLSFGWVSSQLPPAFVQRLKNISAKSSSSVSQHVPVAQPETRPQETAQEVLSEAENREIERLEQNRTLLAAGIGKDASGEEVKNLQRMLWDLGYYHGEITGNYDDATMDAVFRFQVEYDILDSEWDRGAGYFGKKTFEALLSAVEDRVEILAGYPKEVQVWVPANKVLPEIAALKAPEVVAERQSLNFSEELVNKKVVQHESFATELDLNDRGDEVAKLQNFLISRGFLAEGLNTGYFGVQTQVAVLGFQMKQGIVDGPEAPGAGRIGPQTLNVINSL